MDSTPGRARSPPAPRPACSPGPAARPSSSVQDAAPPTRTRRTSASRWRNWKRRAICTSPSSWSSARVRDPGRPEERSPRPAQARLRIEFAPQGFPERTATVFVEAGKQLHQDAIPETRPVHGNVEEPHVAELLAGLALAAELRIDYQPADLRGPVEVVTDGEHAVAKVPVDAGGVVLLLVDVEEDVRRVAGAVL